MTGILVINPEQSVQNRRRISTRTQLIKVSIRLRKGSADGLGHPVSDRPRVDLENEGV